MKIFFIILVLFYISSVNCEVDDNITNEELNELIEGYSGFKNNNGMSEPVS
jgi:hypothetical protein